MKNKQNVFSFYLDEAIWFKEGQGVRELIGISLEPEIVIEEYGDEVRLKGTVDLAGEYVPHQSDHKYEEAAPLQSVRTMDHVESGEEGVYYFSHSFPVEITVPLERISSLEDVLIDIESFDYELPANNQLRLHAQLNINGVEQKANAADNSETFDESATLGPVDYKEERKEKENPVVPEREAPVVQLTNRNDLSAQEIEAHEEGRWPHKKSQNFAEFFGHDKKEETLEVSSESTSVWHENIAEENVSASSSYMESSTKGSEEKEEAPGGLDGIKQIFKHLFPNREETYTQMKMYIAQEDETLASIAEKYEVSIHQLEKVNEHRDEVSPGQIVYIPS
ncbi:stage VI sporulation protein D [Halobacillus sp. B29]|uniref:stage VI sporulation protein D n=1 Tax=Halobacillus sp. B29 TaxID=3457432 RepID=UPI003FCDE916